MSAPPGHDKERDERIREGQGIFVDTSLSIVNSDCCSPIERYSNHGQVDGGSTAISSAPVQCRLADLLTRIFSLMQPLGALSLAFELFRNQLLLLITSAGIALRRSSSQA